MKKLFLLLVLVFGFVLFMPQNEAMADSALPTDYNMTWTVSNPAGGLYEGYSQWVTLGVTPSSFVLYFSNRLATGNYWLVLSSVTGSYTDEISLGYAYDMNVIDLSSITTRDFYSDTRYRFRVQSTTAGSLSAMSSYCESNGSVYQLSDLAPIIAINDSLSFGYGMTAGIESMRSELGFFDETTQTWFGYDEGLIFGYDEGYGVAYNEAYDLGVIEGDSVGYSRGFSDGQATEVNATSIWSATITFLGGIFTLEIFPNVSLGLIISVFVGFFFIKWFLSVVRG